MTSATRALSAAVRGDRLLAERGDSALDGGQRELGVRRSGRRDHHPVDSRRKQLVDRISRCGTVFRRDCGDELRSLVGDHETVDAVQAAEGVGVEGADAAQVRSRRVWSWNSPIVLVAQRDVELFRGVVVGQGRQHGVDLRWRGEAADRLVEVEIGGERVALGRRDDDVEQLALRCGPRPSWRSSAGYTARTIAVRSSASIARPNGDETCSRLAIRRMSARDVGACTVIQRGIEEHRIALAQRHLDVVFGEELDELGSVEGDVAAEEPLRVGQQHRRPALDRHIAVGDRALQGEHRRRAVHVRGVGGQVVGCDEAEVVVAMRNLLLCHRD